ncbi:low-specificity L-threonine aldolase [Alkaliphilus transvaalensis]|uniref:low-specificity L-threonine aldolase n=1 Tax=Alkaliphilus transvaalensis TaxID=114628 RepID=UPI00047C92F5|nr:low-specificity L-threonine aldolase [Alkaliphilus transvaalensis]
MNTQQIFDFRSDTVTHPTEEMLKEIVKAPLGDDVYGDDETVNLLEAKTAELMGKEGALFVPSGTMGNLIAVLAHTTPGQEVILEESCHIYLYEVAGIARIAGVQAKPIKGKDGMILAKDIEGAIRQENIHFPETGLICLENTHNMAGGVVLPLEEMRKVYELAKIKEIPLHIDGARIINAAHHLKVDVKEITQYADSVMFCLSKGLSAPIGSMLVGTKDFIKKARKLRKMLGGGMRQVGIIAAAGLVALRDHSQWMEEDHLNAKKLAFGLNLIDGVRVNLDKVHTNILMADISETGFNAYDLVNRMSEKGLLVNPRNERLIRFVTHRGINNRDVEAAIKIVKEILA